MVLIQQSDARAVRRLSQTFNDDEFSAILLEVQEYYLEPLIGAALYKDLIDNPTSAPNAKLLCGEYYTYSGTKYHFKGVKKYLAYLFFYKFSLEGQVKYTNSGRQNFDVDYADKSKRGIDAQVINNFLSKAQVIGEEILLYLDRNSSSYPLYEAGDTSDTQNKDFNFSVFGSTFTEFKSNG